MINISEVRIGKEEEELVINVLRSGKLAQGNLVQEFENKFASLHQVAHAIAVNNGTTALVASLLALKLQPGDEVITSPFSFVATLNSILEAGATARFADIGNDFCIDPQSIEDLIGPNTRAIMPIHLFGQPAQMDKIQSLAEKYGLWIIEDAAQAHGAKFQNQSVGSFGIGCFSFYATKNLTTGEGGIVTTNDPEIADKLRLLRNQGMRARYQYEIQGHNFRMTEIQAALGIPQLDRLNDISEQRSSNANRLSQGLRGLVGMEVPQTFQNRTHVFHQYTVRLTEGSPLTREELSSHLERDGIASGMYYPKLMNEYDCFTGNPQIVFDTTPKALKASREVLSLPVHQYLTESELDKVIDSVRSAWS